MTNPTNDAETMTDTGSRERADLLETLRAHRGFLRHTLTGLSEEQARTASTISALSVGGLVKHVTLVEAEWARFVVEGPRAVTDWADIDWSNPPAEVVAHQESFQMSPDETVAGVLASYDEAAARTDALVTEVDLDQAWPLPAAPWFEPGATRTARRTFLHIVAETSQHAGHADIVREAIDGQKTMG